MHLKEEGLKLRKLKLKIGRDTKGAAKISWKRPFWKIWVSVEQLFCDFEVPVMLLYSKICGHLLLIVISGYE